MFGSTVLITYSVSCGHVFLNSDREKFQKQTRYEGYGGRLVVITLVWTFETMRKLKQTTNSLMAYHYNHYSRFYYYRLFIFIHCWRISVQRLYSMFIDFTSC